MFKKISWNYFMCSKKLVNTILWFGQVSWKLYSISRPEHGSPHVSYKSVVHVTPVVSIEHIGCFHFFHRDIVRETALKPCVCNCMYVCHRPCWHPAILAEFRGTSTKPEFANPNWIGKTEASNREDNKANGFLWSSWALAIPINSVHWTAVNSR